MTQPRDERPTDLDPEAVVGTPMTGEAAVDDALLGLAELASTPLPEHHDRLARAHESLHAALHHADGPDGAGRRA